MKISSASFVSSSPALRNCPTGNLPEFAFIGRSNVGKSSLINMITGRNKLAKVSSVPGKTRLINHFLINESWYIVDLPGYGFSKIPKAERDRLEKMIESYFLNREQLRLTFLLVDSRHEPQKIDLEFMSWMKRKKIPFVVLFTKSDKLSRARIPVYLSNYRHILLSSINSSPEFILTSSEKKTGREEILERIASELND